MSDHRRTKDARPFAMLFLKIEQKSRDMLCWSPEHVFRGFKGHRAFQGSQKKEIIIPEVSQWD